MKFSLVAVTDFGSRRYHRGPGAWRAKQNQGAGALRRSRPYQFFLEFLLPGHPGPQPNGCAPPVYAYGKYIGQDPDPNIRFQLLRDPATGYSAHQN